MPDLRRRWSLSAAGNAVIALLLSTVLSLAIPAAFVALWLVAAQRIHRRPDPGSPRRTSRLTDTTPRRLL